ncbi:hypothetical protein G7046_g9829 [Stylonectria norvegica]|nr:hypothetical protein G7046_g9829 [Stylonectria norvegica]
MKQQHHVGSSVLFESTDKAIVVVDIARSLEESQVLPSQLPSQRRIYSVPPAATPFATPEPRPRAKHHGDNGPSDPAISTSPAAQLDLLMTHGRNKAEALHGSIKAMRDAFIASAPRLSFKLVLLDPPWPNRSVRRKTDKYATTYDLQEMRELLLQIPVAAHLAPDGLVAVWITNKPSIRDFLTSPTGLFAAWGLELVAEWIWLKVAASGEPLYQVDSQWRKPWEKLVIAKRIGSPKPVALGPKVVVAVPDVHSRKPNVRGLFQDTFGEDYLALEVFARNLTAGWWSWGDDVLHFQQSQHWAPEEET